MFCIVVFFWTNRMWTPYLNRLNMWELMSKLALYWLILVPSQLQAERQKVWYSPMPARLGGSEIVYNYLMEKSTQTYHSAGAPGLIILTWNLHLQCGWGHGHSLNLRDEIFWYKVVLEGDNFPIRSSLIPELEKVSTYPWWAVFRKNFITKFDICLG